MRVPGERTAQIVLVAVALLAVLAVLAVLRATYDDGPTPEERRCTELRASANAVAGREDTVDDELEYLRRAKAADKACAGLDTAFGGRAAAWPTSRLDHPTDPELACAQATPDRLVDVNQPRDRHAGRAGRAPGRARVETGSTSERRGPSNACT